MLTEERCSRFESMLYFSKRPSSTRTMHFPQVAFSAQIDSISTPSSRAAARIDMPSSTCPRRPEGWRMMVCFWAISLLGTAGNLYFRVLRFQLRKERFGNLLGRAVAFDPIPAFVLGCIIGCGGSTFGHRIGIDRVLNPLRELFLYRTTIPFYDK